MEPKPNPVQLAPGRFDGGDVTHRNVFCPHYDGCLDVAVKRGWADFTCTRCELFRKTPPPSAVELSFDQPRE